MMMQEGVIIFNEADRDQDGLYLIPPGGIHIFPFTVPMLDRRVLEVTHNFPNSQDVSLRAWFSAEPFDEMFFFESIENFPLIREPQAYHIFDELVAPDGALSVSQGQTIYFNVQNMQNSLNGYTLDFS